MTAHNDRRGFLQGVLAAGGVAAGLGGLAEAQQTPGAWPEELPEVARQARWKRGREAARRDELANRLQAFRSDCKIPAHHPADCRSFCKNLPSLPP